MSSLFTSPETSSRILNHYPIDAERVSISPIEEGRYRARFAQHIGDLDNLLRLRTQLIRAERDECFAAAHGAQEDDLDAMCHHLIVEDRTTGEIVAGFRLQTAELAAASPATSGANAIAYGHGGTILLDAAVFERACVARRHRNGRVRDLLWRGIVAYVKANGRAVAPVPVRAQWIEAK